MSRATFWLTLGYMFTGERVIMLLVLVLLWVSVWQSIFLRTPKNK